MNRIGNAIHIRVDTENFPADCLRQIFLTDRLLDGFIGKGGKYV